MSRLRSLLFSLSCLLFLVLPAAAIAAKKAGVLRPTQQTGRYVLATDAIMNTREGLVRAKWQWGLHAGIFKATYENDEGVFYEGEGTPVVAIMEKHPLGDYAGGIFVPNADPTHPWLYYYFKPDESTYRSQGALVAWMIKSGTGKINFYPGKNGLQDEAFLATLRSAFKPDVALEANRADAK